MESTAVEVCPGGRRPTGEVQPGLAVVAHGVTPSLLAVLDRQGAAYAFTEGLRRKSHALEERTRPGLGREVVQGFEDHRLHPEGRLDCCHGRHDRPVAVSPPHGPFDFQHVEDRQRLDDGAMVEIGRKGVKRRGPSIPGATGNDHSVGRAERRSIDRIDVVAPAPVEKDEGGPLPLQTVSDRDRPPTGEG